MVWPFMSNFPFPRLGSFLSFLWVRVHDTQKKLVLIVDLKLAALVDFKYQSIIYTNRYADHWYMMEMILWVCRGTKQVEDVTCIYSEPWDVSLYVFRKKKKVKNSAMFFFFFAFFSIRKVVGHMIFVDSGSLWKRAHFDLFFLFWKCHITITPVRYI